MQGSKEFVLSYRNPWESLVWTEYSSWEDENFVVNAMV